MTLATTHGRELAATLPKPLAQGLLYRYTYLGTYPGNGPFVSRPVTVDGEPMEEPLPTFRIGRHTWLVATTMKEPPHWQESPVLWHVDLASALEVAILAQNFRAVIYDDSGAWAHNPAPQGGRCIYCRIYPKSR